jgi:hypothetical protein
MSHIATTAGIRGDDIRDPTVTAAEQRFGRLNRLTRTSKWLNDNGSDGQGDLVRIGSPKISVRNHYGEIDEVVTPGLGRLVMTYQNTIGAGNTAVEAISTGRTDHRGTFVTSVPQWKIWFDGAC